MYDVCILEPKKKERKKRCDIIKDNDKKSHCLYVSSCKIQNIKDMGLSVSTLLETAMDNIIESSGDLENDLRLNILEGQKKSIIDEIIQLDHQIEVKQKEIDIINKKEIKIKEKQKEIEAKEKECELFKKLAIVIVSNDYKEKIIEYMAKDIISEIVKLKPNFDLKNHIRALKYYSN